MYFLMDEVVEKLVKLTNQNDHDEEVSEILKRFKEIISYEDLVEIKKLIDSKLNS